MQAHVSELRTRVAELSAMCATLEELADACHGDQRPECPILRDLAAGPGAGSQPALPTAPGPGQPRAHTR